MREWHLAFSYVHASESSVLCADHAALSFELWRLVQENDMLRARTAELEGDVKDLIETSETLGHSNPKQKLQYHMR